MKNKITKSLKLYLKPKNVLNRMRIIGIILNSIASIFIILWLIGIICFQSNSFIHAFAVNTSLLFFLVIIIKIMKTVHHEKTL